MKIQRISNNILYNKTIPKNKVSQNNKFNRKNVSFAGTSTLPSKIITLDSVAEKPKIILQNAIQPAFISDETLNNLLKENDFKKNMKGEYYRPLTLAQKLYIHLNFKDKYKEIKNVFKPINELKYDCLKVFLAKGNNMELSKTKFMQIYGAFSTIYENGTYGKLNLLTEKKPESLQLVQNIGLNPPTNSKVLDSIKNYKGLHYFSINNTLRGIRQSYRNDINEEIQTLSEYIDKNPIKKPLTLYRGEGLDILSEVKMKNGKTVNLAKMMMNAKTPEQVNKVREFIMDNEITAHQPSFMSTSFDKHIANAFAASSYEFNQDSNTILWELKTTENTKGILLDTIKSDVSEEEVLLQKGSSIKITDAHYCNGFWKLNGEVSN